MHPKLIFLLTLVELFYHSTVCNPRKGKGKGKAIPLQALTGPEGSRKLMLPDFKTVGT
jgi:hypothetical protein